MYDTALIAFITAIVFFIILSGMVRKERLRGRRFFAGGLRVSLDAFVESTAKSLGSKWQHFSRYIVQLNWYYSIHAFLKGILAVIVKFYTFFEDKLERNRKRAKQLRAEKRQLNEVNHLHQMTKHKEDTALTPAQKRKLKKKNLEGKY